MRRLPLFFVLVMCGLTLAGCTQPSSNNAVPEQSSALAAESKAEGVVLNVFTTASLTETFGELEKTFEATHPNVDVVLNLVGFQDLVVQTAADDGADVLATADESTMGKAKEQGLVAEPSVFVKNTLALIISPGNPAGVTGLNSPPDSIKLMICAPEVPCGKLTGKLTAALGVELHPVFEEQVVTDVRGKVAPGEAGAGIVYCTDAPAEGAKVETIDIQGVDQAVSTYPIAVATNMMHSELVQVQADLVLFADGQKVLSDAGFTAAAVR